MDIRIRKKPWTAEKALTRLNEIFDELQASPATHDAWDWMDAGFCLAVIKTCHETRVQELERQNRWIPVGDVLLEIANS